MFNGIKSKISNFYSNKTKSSKISPAISMILQEINEKIYIKLCQNKHIDFNADLGYPSLFKIPINTVFSKIEIKSQNDFLYFYFYSNHNNKKYIISEKTILNLIDVHNDIFTHRFEFYFRNVYHHTCKIIDTAVNLNKSDFIENTAEYFYQTLVNSSFSETIVEKLDQLRMIGSSDESPDDSRLILTRAILYSNGSNNSINLNNLKISAINLSVLEYNSNNLIDSIDSINSIDSETEYINKDIIINSKNLSSLNNEFDRILEKIKDSSDEVCDCCEIDFISGFDKMILNDLSKLNNSSNLSNSSNSNIPISCCDLCGSKTHDSYRDIIASIDSLASISDDISMGLDNQIGMEKVKLIEKLIAEEIQNILEMSMTCSPNMDFKFSNELMKYIEQYQALINSNRFCSLVFTDGYYCDNLSDLEELIQYKKEIEKNSTYGELYCRQCLNESMITIVERIYFNYFRTMGLTLYETTQKERIKHNRKINKQAHLINGYSELLKNYLSNLNKELELNESINLNDLVNNKPTELIEPIEPIKSTELIESTKLTKPIDLFEDIINSSNLNENLINLDQYTNSKLDNICKQLLNEKQSTYELKKVTEQSSPTIPPYTSIYTNILMSGTSLPINLIPVNTVNPLPFNNANSSFNNANSSKNTVVAQFVGPFGNVNITY
jgi:hypothetical protein